MPASTCVGCRRPREREPATGRLSPSVASDKRRDRATLLIEWVSGVGDVRAKLSNRGLVEFKFWVCFGSVFAGVLHDGVVGLGFDRCCAALGDAFEFPCHLVVY